MGEPAQPTPQERRDRRELARNIIAAVTNDEPMPLGLSVGIAPGNKRVVALVAVEELVFALAQELDMLGGEALRLRTLLGREHVLQDGAVHCEHATCLATIDLPLIAASAWEIDARGWWHCPKHVEESRRG